MLITILYAAAIVTVLLISVSYASAFLPIFDKLENLTDLINQNPNIIIENSTLSNNTNVSSFNTNSSNITTNTNDSHS